MKTLLRKCWDGRAPWLLSSGAVSCAAFLVACGALTSNSDGSGADGGGASESGTNMGLDTGSGGDAGASGRFDGQCLIQASDYDQSCTVASDCVDQAGIFPVQFADYCDTQMCLCGGGAINKASAAKYASDVSKTPLGSLPAEQCRSCQYGVMLNPCCIAGRCTTECEPNWDDAGLDDAEAPSDAGGGLRDGSVLCAFQSGVVDADAGDIGPSRWCSPEEKCENLNGGWECCVDHGITFCVPPVGSE